MIGKSKKNQPPATEAVETNDLSAFEAMLDRQRDARRRVKRFRALLTTANTALGGASGRGVHLLGQRQRAALTDHQRATEDLETASKALEIEMQRSVAPAVLKRTGEIERMRCEAARLIEGNVRASLPDAVLPREATAICERAVRSELATWPVLPRVIWCWLHSADKLDDLRNARNRTDEIPVEDQTVNLYGSIRELLERPQVKRDNLVPGLRIEPERVGRLVQELDRAITATHRALIGLKARLREEAS